MTAVHHFEQRLAAAWPNRLWRDLGLLVAISGGADSVALLRAIHALRPVGTGRLIAAHFNHGLRADESDADQNFVSSLCDTLGLECMIGQPQGPSIVVGSDGPEAAARGARYAFLQRSAEQRGARYVITAHTADDQAETILHRILRGTGLAGLGGMPRARALGPAVTLVRPMLEVTRADVLAYLADLDQPFREDSSNRDLRFTRNRLRHELLPRLQRDYAPAIVESLGRLGALAADAQRVIDALATALLDSATISREATRVALDCRTLATDDRHLVREAFVVLWRRQDWPLQAMGYVEWNLLADMALQTTSLRGVPLAKQVLPGAIVAQRQADQLVLCVSQASD